MAKIRTSARILASSLLLTALLAACGGGGSGSAATPPPAAPITLALSGSSNQVISGGTPVVLTASASNGATVNWSLASGNPGTLSATTGASVSYQPPAGISATTVVTITATSGGSSKSYSLTLAPALVQPRLELIAGDDGDPGIIDGHGTQARMRSISNAGVDNAGNLYTGDIQGAGPNAVAALRKVTPDGTVTTLLITLSAIVDGAKGVAQLGMPTCPQPAPAGGVYFVDSLASNNTSPSSAVPIRLLASDSSIRTVASITIQQGDHLCLASGNGKLYALQSQRISIISADGTVSLLAGMASNATGAPSVADGKDAAARFYNISSAAADNSGNLYVQDANGYLVRKVAADGTVTTVAGAAQASSDGTIGINASIVPVDGTGGAARFSSMAGNLTVSNAGNLVLLDHYQYSPVDQIWLRTITPGGVVSSVVVPQSVYGYLVAAPNKVLYLEQSAQILILQSDGSTTAFAGKARDVPADIDGTGATARFGSLIGSMRADAAGNLYVTDVNYNTCCSQIIGPYPTLRKVTPDGVVTTIPYDSSNIYSLATGMIADQAGNTYISNGMVQASVLGGAIYKVAPDGTTSLLAGSSTERAAAQLDGNGAQARFTRPALVGIDANGNLYADDYDASGNLHIRAITSAGVVSTVAALPAGVGAVSDADGNVYTMSYTQSVIYRTAPDGTMAVVAGDPNRSLTDTSALPLPYLMNLSNLVAAGPYTLALVSDGAILRLVLPH